MAKVNAFGKILSFPNDATNEEIENFLNSNVHLLDPNYKQPLMDKAKNFARDVFGYGQPSIAEQAEATAPDSAEVVAPQMRGAPVRQSVYNKALVDRLPGDESAIQNRINKTASTDLSGQRLQSGIGRAITDTAPEQDPELLDYAKGFAAGSNKLVSGIGALAEIAGAKEAGKALRAIGDQGAEFWNQRMSAGGKSAAGEQVFVDDENSLIGVKLSDKWANALLMGAAQSTPSMFAAAIPGAAIAGGISKGVQLLARLGLAGGAGATIPLLSGAAAPVGIGSQVIARIPSAVGFGAAEGIVAGGMNAASLKSSIEAMSDKELSKSPVYVALKSKHGAEAAKQILSDQAAVDLFGKTALSTGTIGALTGGGALGQAYQKIGAGSQGGLFAQMGKGGALEFFQETPQSGGETYIENLTKKKYLDPSIDPMKGVASSALTGGAIGAFTGGVIGGASAVNIGTKNNFSGKRDAAKKTAQNINQQTTQKDVSDITNAQSVDEAINAASKAATRKPVTENDVHRATDPTLADIERLTGLKPSETIDQAISEASQQFDSGRLSIPKSTVNSAFANIKNSGDLNVSVPVVTKPNNLIGVDSFRGINSARTEPVTNSNSIKSGAAGNISDTGSFIPQINNDVSGEGIGNGFFGFESESIKDLPNKTVADIQFISNLNGAKAFKEKGLNALDGDAQGVVMGVMKRIAHDSKVLNSVVRLIPVDVVDDLASNKISPEMLFHNPSMLQDPNIGGNSNSLVPMNVKVANSVVNAITRMAAEDSSAFISPNLVRGSFKGSTAPGTIDNRHSITPNSSVVTGTSDASTSYVPPIISKDKVIKQQDKQPTQSLNRTASWVIKEKLGGKVLFETYDKKKVAALNTDKYEAIPILEYLSSLNKAAKDNNGIDVKSSEEPNFSRDAKDRIKNLERTRKLQKSFDQEGYGLTAKAADVRDFIANDGRKRNEAIASEQIAKAFGKRVTWVDVTGEFDVNGVVVPSIKDTIFIDIKTNKAAHAVLGHELSHHMEYDAPQAYKNMLAALDPLIKDHEGYAKAKEIDGASRDFLIKEIVGDLIGDNFTNQKFWNKVAEYNPSAFKRIADVINTWISRLLDNIRGRGLGSEKWVTDIEKAQDIIAKAVSEYVGNTGQQSTQSDAVIFSKPSKDYETRGGENLSRFEGDGKVFETGKPVTFNYLHNKESATKLFGKPRKDSAFGRFYEPSGKYVVQVTDDAVAKQNPDQYEYGELSFNNPLILANNDLSWKEELSKVYDGKTGKNLSIALIQDGYDGVVTVDKYGTSEILDLKSFDETKAKFSKQERDQINAAELKIPTIQSPDLKYRIGDLPRDMREELFGEHAMNLNPEATERGFYAKFVPSGLIFIRDLKIDKIPANQLEEIKSARLADLPPIVIADGRLIDGQHRIQAAREKGYSQLRYIDVTGLIDTNAGGYVSEIPDMYLVKKESSGDAKFSKAEVDRTLIAQHNLSIKNLLHVDKIGGLAAPSIAITDKAHPLHGFGEITLLAEKDLIDPKQGAKTFGSDIYSPRYPQLTYDFTGAPIKKLNALLADGKEATGDNDYYNSSLENDPERELSYSAAALYQFLKKEGKEPDIKYIQPQEISDNLKPFAQESGDEFDLTQNKTFKDAAIKEYYNQFKIAGIDPINLDENGEKRIIRSYAGQVVNYKNAVKNQGKIDREATRYVLKRQVQDDGLDSKFENYIAELISEANPRERIFQGFTYSGSRRYADHNIDNVIKILKKNLRGGENFNYGLGSIRSKYAPQFKSIKQIRDSKNRLMDSAKFDEVKKEVNQELTELTEELSKYGTFSGFDNVDMMLFDAATIGVNKSLEENGFKNVPAELKLEIGRFINKLKDMPTEYFEAKVLRAVSLGEFSSAIIPDDSPKKVREILQRNGIEDIREYKSGDNEDRVRKINEIDRVMFSRASKTDSIPETINIDGVTRPTRNSEGTPDIRFSFARENPESESNAPKQEQENILPKETTFRKFQREWQDDFNRFQVFKVWLNERGIQLSEKADVSLAEERFHAKVANQIEDFRDFTVSPLIERIAKAGFTMQDVADFLEAQHAPEANAQIQKLYDDPSVTAYGVTDEEAKAYLDKAPEELKNLANEFRDITEKAKKLRLDNGLLNTDITGAWESTYKHYIPVKGAEEKQPGSGKGLSVKFKPKRRLGHGRRDEAVVENIIHDYERAVYEVEKNRVGKHLAMMAAEINLPELMTIDAPVKRKSLKNVTSYQVQVKGATRAVFDTIEAAKVFKEALPLIDKKIATGEVVIAPTTDQRIAAMASPMLADNEINVYIDGHAIRLQINDELAARAYKKLGVEGFGKLVAAGRALNGYLSKVYTGYNPEFILKNLQRDFQTGLLNLIGEEGMMMAARAAYNYPKMFADLFRYAVSNRKNSTKWIDQYRATGGNTGAAYLSDMERLGKEVATEYAAYQGVMSNLKQGKPGFAARAAGKKAYNVFLKWIYNMNQAGENAMRLAAFKAMIDSGKTENEAAHIAKNITVNFNRKGENGQIANAAWLFFNASVQGQAATMHALFKGKHKGQAWALASAYATIGYLAAASLGGGDEDDYDKIDDYTKERNLLISTGDGGWIKLAVPYGYGFFYNTGRVLADAQRKDELGVLPWHIMSSAIEEMTPFGDIVVGSDEQFKMDQVLLGIMPTAAKIPLQVAFNKQLFSGSELMPSSDFDESQPERDKMFRGTKGTVYDNLAGLLENIGFDVSPETLKYSFRTGTGGAGALVDTSISATMLKSQGAELDPGEVPFIRTMYHENNVRADRAAFHKARKEAQTTAEELQRAIKKNDFAKVSEITKDKVEMLMMDKYADKLRKLISFERDAQDSVRLDPNLTSAEKRLKLKEMEKRESAFYDQYLDVFKTKKAEMKAREN